MVFKTLIFKICYLFSFNESSLFYKHLNEIEKYINQFFKYVRIELQALTLVPILPWICTKNVAKIPKMSWQIFIVN